jgi:hypothetical protein
MGTSSPTFSRSIVVVLPLLSRPTTRILTCRCEGAVVVMRDRTGYAGRALCGACKVGAAGAAGELLVNAPRRQARLLATKSQEMKQLSKEPHAVEAPPRKSPGTWGGRCNRAENRRAGVQRRGTAVKAVNRLKRSERLTNDSQKILRKHSRLSISRKSPSPAGSGLRAAGKHTGRETDPREGPPRVTGAPFRNIIIK